MVHRDAEKFISGYMLSWRKRGGCGCSGVMDSLPSSCTCCIHAFGDNDSTTDRMRMTFERDAPRGEEVIVSKIKM